MAAGALLRLASVVEGNDNIAGAQDAVQHLEVGRIRRSHLDCRTENSAQCSPKGSHPDQERFVE
jgi:hypothetical protein